MARRLFRAIETTIGVIGTENESCIAITALDLIGSRELAVLATRLTTGRLFLA